MVKLKMHEPDEMSFDPESYAQAEELARKINDQALKIALGGSVDATVPKCTLDNLQNLADELCKQDFFACHPTAFHMIARQAGVTVSGREFTYNGFRFVMNEALEKGQVVGIGPRCGEAAKAFKQLMQNGKA